MSLLIVDKLGIRYDGEAVVDELSFAVDAGESVGLVGESGSGKTQTGLAILGLLPATAKVSGRITLGDTEVIGAGDDVVVARYRCG